MEPAKNPLVLALLRRAPCCIVVDEHMNIVMQTADERLPHAGGRVKDILAPEAFRRAEILVRGLQRGGVSASVSIVPPNTLVRVTRLYGASAALYGIFVEEYQARDSINSAAKRYNLSRREVEIVSLIVRGESTNSIAERLFIAPGTVNSHVKSIARKMGSSKRTEIVAKIFDVE